MQSSESELDKIFLSYNKILKKLNSQGYKTKNGNEITHKDLRYAINFMIKKHPNCRWKSTKIRSKKFYILIEGYYWLTKVFFQNEKEIIDADIIFFETRIIQYEKLLNLKSKKLFSEDIEYSKLEKFFNRKPYTIKKAIRNLEKKYDANFRFLKNKKMYVNSNGIELLCKNFFKKKYLEILENYKMELTEKYIEAGYIYDNFFYLN